MGVIIQINQEGGGGTPAELAVSITYAELKVLCNGGNLVPGTWYRITDYACTTTQGNTQSANHAFDILVRADDESHLNENAYAAHHDGDNYFANSKLEAWQLKYCLDNDTSRFGWAADGSGGFWVEYKDKDTVRLMRTAIIEGKETVWQYGEGKELYYSAPDPVAGDYLYTDESLSENPVEITAVGEISGEPGTGVVYYMKDEFGNECPYDFKNIMFKRFEITAVKTPQGVDDPNHFLIGAWGLPTSQITVDPETSEWFYTFSSVNDNTVIDASLSFDYNDINGQGSGASLNVMKPMQKASFRLNNNVFINASGDLICVGNIFERNCQNNTLANYCRANKFGDYCELNQFSQNCWYNSFSQNCYSNNFSQGCSENQFSQDCSFNNFSQGCSANQFSQYCQSNQFSQNCSQNQFSQYCSNNSFSQNCSQNQFSQGCSENQFSQNCQSNQFSQYCQHNTLPQRSQYLRFNAMVNYVGIALAGDKGAPKDVQILSGVGGTNLNPLTVTVEPDTDYTQMVAMTTQGSVKVWNPADLVP